MGEMVKARERDARVLGEYDVVVAGGGSAGLAAALSAARLGAKTALVERYGFFGGNAVSAYVGTVCGLYLPKDSSFEEVSGGLAREWAQALMAEGNAFGPVPFKQTAVVLYVPWAFKRLADRLVRETPNLTPLLHAPIIDAYLDNEELRGVIVGSKTGPVALMGRVFVDATGDADLSFHAGTTTEMGPVGERQFPSMQFLIENANFETARQAAVERISAAGTELDARAISQAVTAMLSELLSTKGQQEPWNLSRSGGAVFPTFRQGEVLGAMTRIHGPAGGPPDMTDLTEATHAEMAGRDEAEKAHRFLTEHLPGFEESFLADTPAQLGIRETRRIEGVYVLTHEDFQSAARFEDTIGRAAWPEEFHWKGKGTEYVWLDDGASYQMPYRMLQSKELANLLVAGRCASASAQAMASTRVIATSMVQGEAAGTAAALSAQQGIGPKDLDVPLLQKTLEQQGALLI